MVIVSRENRSPEQEGITTKCGPNQARDCARTAALNKKGLRPHRRLVVACARGENRSPEQEGITTSDERSLAKGPLREPQP